MLSPTVNLSTSFEIGSNLFILIISLKFKLYWLLTFVIIVGTTWVQSQLCFVHTVFILVLIRLFLQCQRQSVIVKASQNYSLWALNIEGLENQGFHFYFIQKLLKYKTFLDWIRVAWFFVTFLLYMLIYQLILISVIVLKYNLYWASDFLLLFYQ